jgi:chromosome segregation ATPase
VKVPLITSTVITGPNGSGKSNLIEAVAFTLCVDIKELRVTTLNELCGNVKEKTSTQLVYSLGKSSNIIINCSIINGNRSYKLNGVNSTKEKIKFLIVHTLGYAKDSVCWMIGQSSIQRVINATPISLYNTLTFIAGTHLLQESKSRIEVQLVTVNSLFVILRKSIASLDQSYQDDKELLLILNKSKTFEEDIRLSQLQLAHVEKEYFLLSEYTTKLFQDNINNEIKTLKEKLNLLEMNEKKKEVENEELTHLQTEFKALNLETKSIQLAYDEEHERMIDLGEKKSSKELLLADGNSRLHECNIKKKEYTAVVTNLAESIDNLTVEIFDLNVNSIIGSD